MTEIFKHKVTFVDRLKTTIQGDKQTQKHEITFFYIVSGRLIKITYKYTKQNNFFDSLKTTNQDYNHVDKYTKQNNFFLSSKGDCSRLHTHTQTQSHFLYSLRTNIRDCIQITFIQTQKPFSIYMSVYLSVCLSICLSSPWYNRTGWLGVKHQLTYLLTICLPACLAIYMSVCQLVCL